MNNSKKLLLRNTLIAGVINVETSNKIKEQIFVECHLDKSKHNDRALWSAWITGKSVPNRYCQAAINDVLVRNQLQPIYD